MLWAHWVRQPLPGLACWHETWWLKHLCREGCAPCLAWSSNLSHRTEAGQQGLHVRLTAIAAKAAALCRYNWVHVQCCGPARAPGERQQPYAGCVCVCVK